jgi:tetratricopeptide (TPR) repeat protein
MDCRISALVASGLMIFGAGCVTTQSPPSSPSSDPPPNASVQKAADGPKRPPLPVTVVSLGLLKEREADKCQDASTKMKLYDEARQYYQQALKLDAKCRDATQGLARVYSRMDDYAHALDVYQKALDKDSKDHGLWFDLGMCYSRKKQFAQAVPCFRKALDLAPENRQYMKTLGFTLAYAGQTDQGLAMLTSAMGAGLAHYNLARVLEHQGNLEQSRQHLQLALQFNPTLEQAREMLATAPTARATIQVGVE